MFLCIYLGYIAHFLPLGPFELTWVHSIERTEWHEIWQAGEDGLVFQYGMVRGSGAGVDIPENAIYRDGYYQYTKPLQLAELHLASSGQTISGWRITTHTKTLLLENQADDILIKPCYGKND